MSQLALFEGAHVPRTAAREALSQDDLGAACALLEGLAGAKAEAAEAGRLARIHAALGADPGAGPQDVHDAFVRALLESGAPGFLSKHEWFELYARRMAGALAPQPGGAFRGWLGAHYAFAARLPERARQCMADVVARLAPGPAWIEAARLAFALEQPAEAQAWIHRACLEAEHDLGPAPPGLEPCGIAALDAAPALPPLPAPVEEVFEVARALEDLPGPWVRWVAVVGEIDRVLSPRRGAEAGAARPEAWEAGEGGAEGAEADAPRAFLAALRAARRSRERDRVREPGRCSQRELRARRRMQQHAPVLLERYVHGLAHGLF